MSSLAVAVISDFQKMEHIVDFEGMTSSALFLLYLFCIHCVRIESFWSKNFKILFTMEALVMIERFSLLGLLPPWEYRLGLLPPFLPSQMNW